MPPLLCAGDYTLALPKLNLQFLTIHDAQICFVLTVAAFVFLLPVPRDIVDDSTSEEDYLLRNFNLFRLESTHEIRDDLQDQIPRHHRGLCKIVPNFHWPLEPG